MPNPSNLNYPPDFWRTAEPHADRKVLLVGAGLGPNPFSGSLRFLGPYVRQQPQNLPDNWRTAGAVAHVTRSTPALQRHLTHPPFAASAQHDLGPLHGIETRLKALAPAAEDAFWASVHLVSPLGGMTDAMERGFGNKPGDVERSAGAGAARSVGSAVRGVGAFGDSTTRSLTRLFEGERGVADYQRRRAHGNFAPMPSDVFTALSHPLFEEATLVKRGVRDTPLTRTSESAGYLAPGLAASFLGPEATMAFFGAQGADDQNQAAVAAGKVGTWQADLGVLGNAGVQGGLGLIPGGKFERFVPRFASPAANLAVKAGTPIVAGALGGAVSNASGNAIEKYTVNPDKNVWDGTLESLATGGLLSAVHVGVDTARGRGSKARAVKPEPAAHPVAAEPGHVEAVRPAAPAPQPHPAMKAARAVVDHRTLTEAVQSARDSVMRQEDPDQFQAFTARAAEVAQVPDLHVAPDALDAVLATPEGRRVQAAIPDIADRVVAARDAGSDVTVSPDEYLTHVGPELHDRIAGDVRVGPDAMTPAEAVADHQSRVGALKAASAVAEASASDPEAFRQSRQDVADAVRRQYDHETVGKLTPEQRAAAADLAGHAIAVEGARQRVEPMEAYQQVLSANSLQGRDQTLAPQDASVVAETDISRGNQTPFERNSAPEQDASDDNAESEPLANSDRRRPSIRTETRNGYTYGLDELGFAVKIEGNLTLNITQGRNTKAQRNAGGANRLATDEGGHYIGRRFNGPTEEFNHFAQDINFNRGEYKRLENEWHRALNEGQAVHVEIEPVYSGNSLRPHTINIKYTIDEKTTFKSFNNKAGG